MNKHKKNKVFYKAAIQAPATAAAIQAPAAAKAAAASRAQTPPPAMQAPATAAAAPGSPRPKPRANRRVSVKSPRAEAQKREQAEPEGGGQEAAMLAATGKKPKPAAGAGGGGSGSPGGGGSGGGGGGSPGVGTRQNPNQMAEKIKNRYMGCQFQTTSIQSLVSQSESWAWAKGKTIEELDRVAKRAAAEAEKLGLTFFLLQPAKESRKTLGNDMFAELTKRTNTMEVHVAEVEKAICKVQNMHALAMQS